MSEAVFITNRLERDLSSECGSTAQSIYDMCCCKFKWDRSKRSFFGKQQVLYAEGATPEGFIRGFSFIAILPKRKAEIGATKFTEPLSKNCGKPRSTACIMTVRRA